MRGVRDFSAAFIALLRGVRGVHRDNPATVLRHIVSKPPHKLASVPPAVLHGVSNPAQIFNRDDSYPTGGRDKLSPARRELQARVSSGTLPRDGAAPHPTLIFWLAGHEATLQLSS